jgi:hypothetical protein
LKQEYRKKIFFEVTSKASVDPSSITSEKPIEVKRNKYDATTTCLGLFAEGLSAVNFIIYLSGISAACSTIFFRPCWHNEEYNEIRTFLRYEYYIFIMGLIAMPVFIAIKWVCN